MWNWNHFFDWTLTNTALGLRGLSVLLPPPFINADFGILFAFVGELIGVFFYYFCYGAINSFINFEFLKSIYLDVLDWFTTESLIWNFYFLSPCIYFIVNKKVFYGVSILCTLGYVNYKGVVSCYNRDVNIFFLNMLCLLYNGKIGLGTLFI